MTRAIDGDRLITRGERLRDLRTFPTHPPIIIEPEECNDREGNPSGHGTQDDRAEGITNPDRSPVLGEQG
jgi:hypothetical protein